MTFKRTRLHLVLLILVLLAALLTLSTVIEEAQAAEIVVNPGESIQEAIGKATAGDTITVKNGEYQENIIIDKRLTLRGEDNQNTIIDTAGEGVAITVTADSVNVFNFNLKIGSDFYDRGINATSVATCAFAGNRVTPNGSNVCVGLYLTYVNNTDVAENVVDGVNSGLILKGSSGTNRTA